MTGLLFVITFGVLVGTTQSKANLLLGFMGIQHKYNIPIHLDRLGAALPMALDFINNSTDILPNTTLMYTLQNSGCNNKVALDGLVQLHMHKHVDAIIGPACSTAAESMALLASKWNIPIISYSVSSKTLSDKKIYDTFIRTSAPVSQMGEAVRGLIRQFNWTRVGVISIDYAGHLVKLTQG